ncbi:MAG: 30S ribosomal protein S15 [Candidatus Odinarchaeota archaeon]
MARMHSKRRGKSKSVRPPLKKAPEWCTRTSEEVEALIVKYARSGETASKIGLILRDQHGIPLTKNIANKKITQILREKGLAPQFPEDLSNLIRKAQGLKTHLEEHPKDFHSKRGLQLIESKIRRLTEYYKSKNMLPANWKYTSMDKAMVIR